MNASKSSLPSNLCCENKLINDTMYEMNLNWTGSCSCIDIGVANCKDEDLVKLAFHGHHNLYCFSAHCTLNPIGCPRLSTSWTANDTDYESGHFNMKRCRFNLLTESTVQLGKGTIRIGITWGTGKISLWVHGKFLKILTYKLKRDQNFYLFVRFYVPLWQASRVRVDPIPTPIRKKD